VGEDAWADLADRFSAEQDSLKGLVRRHLLQWQLLRHLPPPPAPIVDVGGGAGHQSLPLARLGYEVTIADSSVAMLDKARERLATETAEIRERVQLVAATGEQAPAVLGAGLFAAVLCHGVIMYVDDPTPLVAALCRLVAPGGIVSIAALNADALALRPAWQGRWRDALVAMDTRREVGVLGVETRADTVLELVELLAGNAVECMEWYGVCFFSEHVEAIPEADRLSTLLDLELEAGRRDPYRRLSRLVHVVGRKER
jgi:2-polyprenyl-3-methyl-5-hydroxy-6-metoxy-1,4-benzoquinol methylase